MDVFVSKLFLSSLKKPIPESYWFCVFTRNADKLLTNYLNESNKKNIAYSNSETKKKKNWCEKRVNFKCLRQFMMLFATNTLPYCPVQINFKRMLNRIPYTLTVSVLNMSKWKMYVNTVAELVFKQILNSKWNKKHWRQTKGKSFLRSYIYIYICFRSDSSSSM